MLVTQQKPEGGEPWFRGSTTCCLIPVHIKHACGGLGASGLRREGQWPLCPKGRAAHQLEMPH